MFAVLAMIAVAAAPVTAAADQPINCTCGDKKFSGSCPSGQSPHCDCSEKKVKCTKDETGKKDETDKQEDEKK